ALFLGCRGEGMSISPAPVYSGLWRPSAHFPGAVWQCGHFRLFGLIFRWLFVPISRTPDACISQQHRLWYCCVIPRERGVRLPKTDAIISGRQLTPECSRRHRTTNMHAVLMIASSPRCCRMLIENWLEWAK